MLSPRLIGKPLSKPELEVLRAAAEGLSAKETARKLMKSEHTVIAQRRAIQGKLGARNLAHAITLAFRRRVLQPTEPR
jgi:two-component system nitrate/nitrite response regulator NarL